MKDLKEVIEAVIDCSARAAEIHEVRKAAFVPEVRSIDQEARTIEFVSSTESVDRYGDIIRVAGWDTRNYMKNPVFLWGHQSSQPPIGKTVSLKKETGARPALIQMVQFATKSEYPFADTIFNLYKGGFMKAVSVGFKPLEVPAMIKDKDTGNFTGYEFTKQELLELSAVPIPANPEAVARMVDAGMVEQGDVQKLFVDPKSAPETFEGVQDVLLRLAALETNVKMIVTDLMLVRTELTRTSPSAARAHAITGEIKSLDQLFQTLIEPTDPETPTTIIQNALKFVTTRRVLGQQ